MTHAPNPARKRRDAYRWLMVALWALLLLGIALLILGIAVGIPPQPPIASA